MNSSTAFIWIYFGIVYSIYYVYTFDSPGRVEAIRKKFGQDRGELVRITTARLFVFFALGLVPWLLIPNLFNEPNSHWGVVLLPTGREVLFGTGVGVVAVALILINPNKRAFTKKYPQMRINRWSSREIAVNLITWVLYLSAYETMFRGYLLFSLRDLGMIPAIAIIQTLYIIIHLPFGGLVTVGTIPFGIAVGWLAWNEESFWIAFIAHIAVAFAHTIQSAILNPDMIFPARKEPTQDG